MLRFSTKDLALTRQVFSFLGRAASGVTARMRINDNGTLYDITSPPLDWDNRHVYMTVLAKTGIDRG